MGVISTRVADEDEHLLKAAHVNISALLRAAIEDEVARLRRRDALTRLTAIAAAGGPATEDVVREARDA